MSSVPTENEWLAQLVDKTRFVTRYYIDKLKDTDLTRVFVADGIPLNSAYWIMAHLAVTQNGLLLRCTGGQGVRIPWAKQFNMGSTGAIPEDAPSVEEILRVMDEVHTASLAHIRSLDPAFLDQINPAGFEIMGEKTVRGMIIHHVRHESGHAGHLGWLCKLNGIKTM